jgi:periplasmic protein TonB
MDSHIDILEQSDSLGKPFAGSIVLHVSLVAFFAAYFLIGSRARDVWGSPNAGGGGLAINVGVVNKIPLPGRSGVINPLANDTESVVPQPPPKPEKQERQVPEEPDAVPLPGRTQPRKAQPPASPNKFRARQQDAPNQLYSSSGPALVSPMVGMTGGSGVGVGPGTPFGNRFGAYVDILRQRVAEKWRTMDVDPRLKSAPPVIVTFALQRDGSARDVRIAQASGNSALDYSAQRAIYDASPFPPLPAGYDGSEARIEFWFQLKR